MTCPSCVELEARIAHIETLWRRNRRRYMALHQKHEYLISAWSNACAENELLRKHIRDEEERAS